MIIPESVKEANTPLPSTGIVLLIGEGLWTKTGTTYYEGNRDGKFISVRASDVALEFNVAGLHAVIKQDTQNDSGLQEGDMVMYGKYAGSDASVDKETYKILFIDDIMCTLVPTNPEAYAVTTD